MKNNYKMYNESEFEFDEVLNMGFTSVPNSIFEDNRLTYNAVGIYCSIIRRKNMNNWKIYQSSLVNDTNGKCKIMSAMKELIECGWITKIQLRNIKGQLTGVKYTVYSSPQSTKCITQTPKSENRTSVKKLEKPTSENPKSENPTSEKQPLQKKTTIKKDCTKKDFINTTLYQPKEACSSYHMVEKRNSNVNLIENNTHLKLTNNQFKKVDSWNTTRLRKSIKIFIKENGEYFSLLEKIYLDNKNFVPQTTKVNKNTEANFTERNYDYDKLEQELLGWNTEYDEDDEDDDKKIEADKGKVIVANEFKKCKSINISVKETEEPKKTDFDIYLEENQMSDLVGWDRQLEYDKFIKNGSYYG